jgi:hypothetical protein
MSCDFHERIDETIRAKKGAYTVDGVRSMLNEVIGQLVGGIAALKDAVPRKTKDRELRTRATAPRPSWQGQELPFKARLLVEADTWIGWLDAIDIQLEGRATIRALPDGTVETLRINISLKFEARDKAMPAVQKGVSKAAGHEVTSCDGVQTELRRTIGAYTQTLREAAKRGVQDFKKALVK